jgi:glycosyltransferase involved in cell wall biosynthesis
MSAIAVEDGIRIAVLLPCHNHAATIGAVVQGFAEALPGADIYVFDNNSTDDTARIATRAGARVRREARQGKANVVRRMFADIEADIYVLADGDGTYDPADAPSLVNALVTERADMAVGMRGSATGRAATTFARRVLDRLYRRSIGVAFVDVFSGYRALTRRFVKSFPAITRGFDIEAELSMHAGQMMIPVAEIDLTESRRPDGQRPSTVRDGLRVLRVLARLMKETRPFAFYCALALVFWIAGLALAAPAISAWATAGPQAGPAALAAATGLFVVGFVSAACGLVLDSVGRTRVEQKRILFLTVPALGTR